MRKFLALLLITTCFITTGFAQKPQNSQSNTPFNLAPLVKRAMPSVASIMVKQDIPLGKRITQKIKDYPSTPFHLMPELSVLGAGVIVDSHRGLLVTNAHVVQGAKQIAVFFKNNERYIGHLLGKSDDFDIAVIQINAKNIPAIPFANSDNVQAGDFVIAIGNPYGLSQTVTSGIVSAVNRTQSFWNGYQDLIQTDAPINLGNSGGPLLNMKGQLIGINTAAIFASPKDLSGNIGLGFAIPSQVVGSIVSQLEKYGNIKKGTLGVVAQNITPDLQKAFKLPKAQGCLITQIVPRSAASKAGIQPKDILLKIDGRPILTATQLRSAVLLTRPGTHVKLTLVHNKMKKTITAIIGDAEKQKPTKPRLLNGLTLQTFHELEANGDKIHGVGIVYVDENSMGQLAGLLPGDIILNANQKPTTNLETLEKLVNNQDRLLLEILRNKGKLFIVLKQN